ncbi:MAG: hypothetical protein LBP39_00105 [Rickettsiales bacterium]|jgi:hypothetical protein|nr:hypothetical protein [Rickettsiales bacterium]
MVKQIKSYVSGTRKYVLAFTILFLAWLILYTVQLLRVRSKIIDQLDRQTTNYALEHGKVTVKFLSPLKIGINVEDLKLSFSGPAMYKEIPNKKPFKGANSYFKNVLFTSPLLSKKLNIYVPDEIAFDNGSTNGFIKLVNYSIYIKIGNNSKFEEIQILAGKVQNRELTPPDSEFLDLVKNFSLLISNDNKTKDQINTAIRVNIDAIYNRAENIVLESNFELIASNTREIDEYGNVNSIAINIEKSNFNDIANNFGVDISGNYRVSAYVGAGKADFEFKIINFKSLVNSLNKPNSEFPIFGKKSINDLVQLLELMPKNPKDTNYDRYYRITSDLISKKVTVNGVDLNSLLQELFTGGGNSKK